MKMLSFLLVVVACGGGGGPHVQSKYPPLPAGCDVKLFHETPTMATDNIGRVEAHCDSDRVSEEDCIRDLKDQACKLGANVIWEVPFKPNVEDNKQYWSGRAAHTK